MATIALALLSSRVASLMLRDSVHVLVFLIQAYLTISRKFLQADLAGEFMITGPDLLCMTDFT